MSSEQERGCAMIFMTELRLAKNFMTCAKEDQLDIVLDYEAGFSLLEVLLALGVASLMFALVVASTNTLIHRFINIYDQQRERLALDDVEDQIRSDVASALVVHVGNAALVNTSNGCQAALQLMTTDAAHHWYDFGYQWCDGELQRVDHGSIVARYPSIQKFAVQFIPAHRLRVVAPGSTSLLASLPAAKDFTTTLDGQVVASGSVEISMVRSGLARTLHLATQVAPSSFGLESGPEWHAVVWREGHTRRNWFGLAQRTTYDIFGQISYSYDHWQTDHVWCVHQLASGLRVSDAEASLAVQEREQTAGKIFALCQHDLGEQNLPRDANVERGLQAFSRDPS